MNILIADDDPVSLRLLEATLLRGGHSVQAVCDGADALAALTKADGPRLAILDWMMPSVDGLQVCRAIRRERGSPYVYLILLTSKDRREDMVAGLEAEADDFLTKPFDALELAARLRSGARVLAWQQQLLQTQHALLHEATHDHLTGLWNRATILDRLETALRLRETDHAPLSVAIADLDHFKRINDTRGHRVGDSVLREASTRMRAMLPDDHWLGRYGGEEFLIVLPGHSPESAKAVANRVCSAVADVPVRAGDSELSVSVSLGVAGINGTTTSAGDLIQAADEALYRAKALGRRRVEL